MSFFRFEFRHQSIYYDFLGVLSDTDGKFYYSTFYLKRFLSRVQFRNVAWRRCTTLQISDAFVEHDELLRVLRDLDTDKSSFLFNFLENGYVRPLVGPWFNEHRIQMCDASDQSFTEWRKDFDANYGPYSTHQAPEYVKDEYSFSTLSY